MAIKLQILLDVAEGLNHLHAISLSHGALKTTNILLDHRYHAKVLVLIVDSITRVHNDDKLLLVVISLLVQRPLLM